jgi:VIT1/CCC1 family predicted Fe2+/Mn2+ transporter
MSDTTTAAEAHREPVLSPVDRISELLFGLLMALSFVGAVSVAEAGRAEIRELFVAALGCNLAWGLVDAVMYLVRTVADRGRALRLVHAVRSVPDAQAGRRLIERSLSRVVSGLVSTAEVEAIRGRIVAQPAVPERPTLGWNDLRAAVAIFVLVVVATFPVVLPFALMQDVATAKNTSHAIALAMLFLGGLAFGRYAGSGSWKPGLAMAALGTVLVIAINALGG